MKCSIPKENSNTPTTTKSLPVDKFNVSCVYLFNFTRLRVFEDDCLICQFETSGCLTTPND